MLCFFLLSSCTSNPNRISTIHSIRIIGDNIFSENLVLKEHRTVTHRTHKIRHCQKKLSVADGKCMKNTTKEIPRCSNSSSYVVSLKKIILLINPDLAWITEAFECQFQMLGVYYVVCLQIIRGNFTGEQADKSDWWLMRELQQQLLVFQTALLEVFYLDYTFSFWWWLVVVKILNKTLSGNLKNCS